MRHKWVKDKDGNLQCSICHSFINKSKIGFPRYGETDSFGVIVLVNWYPRCQWKDSNPELLEKKRETINVMELIICSAIKVFLPDGMSKIFNGHRHNHCIDAMNGELSWTMNRQEITELKKEQGFITSHNRFVDRKEGAKIWIACGKNAQFEELYSEDIY